MLIIIFDELIVGFDFIIECELMEMVFEVLKGKMILWIMYYFVGVEVVDKIVFFENGKIEMEGMYEELLVLNE